MLFFRDDEIGERIISGQQARIAGASERPEDLGAISPWKATVESGDFVVLSSTPSFDPRVGMDDPGNPEHYQVLPNAYKGEGGTYVEGRCLFPYWCKREKYGSNSKVCQS